MKQYRPVDQIKVSLDFGDEPLVPVGRLAIREHTIYFQYEKCGVCLKALQAIRFFHFTSSNKLHKAGYTHSDQSGKIRSVYVHFFWKAIIA